MSIIANDAASLWLSCSSAVLDMVVCTQSWQSSAKTSREEASSRGLRVMLRRLKNLFALLCMYVNVNRLPSPDMMPWLVTVTAAVCMLHLSA